MPSCITVPESVLEEHDLCVELSVILEIMIQKKSY